MLSKKEIYSISSFDTFKSILLVFAPFPPFYYWRAVNKFSYKKLNIFVILLLLLTVFQYFQTSVIINTSDLNEIGYSVNNIGYEFIMLIPLIILLYWRKKKTFTTIIAIIILFALLSAKRGAIVCALISLLIFGFYYIKLGAYKKAIRNVLIISFIFSIITFFVYMFIESNEFLQERIRLTLDGESSGRNQIYSSIINYWVDSNDIVFKVFGGGINTSISITKGIAAHNDWLEMLSSMGLIGIILYSCIIINFIRIKNNCKNDINMVTMSTTIYIWLAMSMFSIVLYSQSTYLLIIPIAIISAENTKHKLHNYEDRNNR